MSRNRNRNIKNKFHIASSATSQHQHQQPKPQPSQQQQQGNLTTTTVDSGIVVTKKRNALGALYHRVNNNPSSLSSVGSLDVDILDDDDDVTIVGRNDSFDSESSMSWAEDYEIQATNLVKEEYERMERVLQCLEAIPAHYDKEEYKLWIKTFPCLSLTSQNSARSTKSRLFQLQADDDKNDDENLSVIDKLIDDLYPKTTKQEQQQPHTTFSSSKDLAINSTINPRTLNVKVDSFLQIAPVNLPNDDLKQVINARTVNWLENLEIHNAKSLPLTTRQKRKKSSFHSHNYKVNSDFIILPPIEADANQFRSISATFARPNISLIEYDRLQKRNRFVKLE